MSVPKILFFDLENVQEMENIFHPGNRMKHRAAGFCSDLAYILVFGYKWLNGEGGYILPDDDEFKKTPHDSNSIDKKLIDKALDIIDEADVVVSWYGSGHDLPFLTGRALHHGLVIPQNIHHLDLYKTARNQFSLSSNRMDNVAGFLGCEHKTKVTHDLWPKCWFGDTGALNEMAEYCYQDVVVLEQIYKKLLPVIKNHPHINTIMGTGKHSCPHCGHDRSISKGLRVTKTKKYRRRSCMSCGASFSCEIV